MEKTFNEFDETLKETLPNMMYNTVTNVSGVINALAEARIAQKITYNELSELSGVSPNRLRRFDSAKRMPSLIDLCSIAAALGKEVRICNRE